MFGILTLLSLSMGLPVHAQEPSGVSSSDRADQSIAQSPRRVGFDPVPDLSLPKTVVSNVDQKLGSGRAIQHSPDNITLYNPQLKLRLLGGRDPRDELVISDGRLPAPRLSWDVEARVGSEWVRMVPESANLGIHGTNSSGTFVSKNMTVAAASYGGIFNVNYELTNSGSLKWELQFTPSKTGEYRLEYLWNRLPLTTQLAASSKEFHAQYENVGYTFTWTDIPSSFNTTGMILQNSFQLLVDLGTLSASSSVVVDPYMVGTSTSATATDYTFQRRVFYEPKAGNYWAFYYDGSHLRYKYSHDGIQWLPTIPYSMPAGWTQWASPDEPFPAIFNSGQTVILAMGSPIEQQTIHHAQWANATIILAPGEINGSTIDWNSVGPSSLGQTFGCFNGSIDCSMTFGTRDLSITSSSNGQLYLAFNGFYKYTPYENAVNCPGALDSDASYFSQSAVYTVPINPASSFPLYVWGANNGGTSCYRYDRNYILPSVVVPSDSQGAVRVLYQCVFSDKDNATLQLSSYELGQSTAGCPISGALATDTLYVPASPQFSAVADRDYSTHVVYRDRQGTVDYAYKPLGGTWTVAQDIFSGGAAYPSITVDFSTNDVYAFALSGSSIVMKSKPLSKQWSDQQAVYPVTGQVSPSSLGSNLVSVGGSNSSWISLVWTTGTSPNYNVMYAGWPIPSVWSPYSSPASPWDGNGIAPSAEYFSNLGEYVSPSSGMLTVRQTDLTVPGRGLDLGFTRVYTEPASFLNGVPYNFEKYPWAPVGNGWQLNFPWMTGASNPVYLHLLNGEGYRIPFAFWNGASGIFENHQGEQFRLVRNSTATYLFSKDGTSYRFDPSNHALVRIADTVGNTVSFAYNNSGRMANITDTVGRVFRFYYWPSTLLKSINQTGAGGTGSVRGVTYDYDINLSLVSAKDPAGSPTTYAYSAPSTAEASVRPWLLSTINYATELYGRSYTQSYNYYRMRLGTEELVYTYRVAEQFSIPPVGPTIRHFTFTYVTGPGDQVTQSTITMFNGTSSQPSGYKDYAFSFAGMTGNVSDSNHRLVSGVQLLFGPGGQVIKEIALVTSSSGAMGSYTNYYGYDPWGNQIYSRRAINSVGSAYHENYNTYYNAGLPPAFYAFQDTFSQLNNTRPDQSWTISSGYWLTRSGQYSGVSSGGAQENVFASATINKANVSLQARVFITRQVISSDARVGLFVHYPGTGASKWALVLHNRPWYEGGGTYLELLDELSPQGWLGLPSNFGGGGQAGASASCSLSFGIWYVFNMTVYGNRVVGWAGPEGGSLCSTVTGTFSLSSPAVNGSGFGLYAGGYEALFDNVVVATVSPYITGTSFSNSFIQNGAPNSIIHGTLAGRAELQNGTGSAPVETYYGYWSWGGVNQVKRLYNSPSGTQWLTSSATYDSYGNPKTYTSPRGGIVYYSFSANYTYAYLTNETRLDGATRITTLYAYNFTTGKARIVTDPVGNATTYQYDILGRLTRIIYPRSLGSLQYIYDYPDNHVDTINTNGWTTRQAFDGLGRLIRLERFSIGRSYSNETYAYNWMGKIVSRTDPLGNTTRYDYDVLGRVKTVTGTDGNTTTVTYNDLASMVVTSDATGNNRCYTYDRFGRLVSVVEGSTSSLCVGGIATNYFYDEVGNLVRVSDPNVQSTTRSYDSLNRLTSTRYPDATSESYAYDNDGNPANKLDRNGVTTAYTYDSLDRLTKVNHSGAIPASEAYTFDRNSNLSKLNSSNATLTYTYDARNRVLSEAYVVNPPLTASFTYSPSSPDAGVPVTFTATASGGSGVYTFNWNFGDSVTGTGNPASHTYSGGGCFIVTLTVNDTASNQVSSSQTVCVNGGDGSVAAGTLITLADGSQVPVQDLKVGMRLLSYNTTTNRYVVSTIERLETVQTDNMLIIQTTSPLDLRTDYALAQKLWVKQATGSVGWLSVTQLRVGDYLFNALDQTWSLVKSIKHVPGSFTMYDVYNTAPGNYLANGYLDPKKLRPSTPILPIITSTPTGAQYAAYTVRFSYSGDALDTLTYPDGRVAKYSYDTLGRVVAVSNATRNYATFTYDLDGAIKGVGFGNGLVENYTLDRMERPSTITLKNGGTVLVSLNYQYDKRGLVTSADGQQYAYDAMGRLVTFGPSGSGYYQYDNAGNRVYQHPVPDASKIGSVNYYYTQAGKLLSWFSYGPALMYPPNGHAQDVSYTYYADGSLKSQNVTAGGATSRWTYAFDVPGNMVKETKDGATVGLYAYDGLGRRVLAVESSATFYAYMGTETLYEKSGTSNTDYVYAAGLRIARVAGVAVNYYHSDLLGSTRRVTDALGNTVFSNSYQAFGQDDSASGTETYKYTGKPWSSQSQLYYNYQRWYDPVTGRFISHDPDHGLLGLPQSLNPYTYVLNIPTVLKDPTGRGYSYDENRAVQTGAFWKLVEGEEAATVRLRGATIASYNGNVVTAQPVNTATFWEGVEESSSGDNEMIGKSWELGDPPNAATRDGNYPSWTTVRQRFWQNEAVQNQKAYSQEDLARMQRGLAPRDQFGRPIELHHIYGRDISDPHNPMNLEPLTATAHRLVHWFMQWSVPQ